MKAQVDYFEDGPQRGRIVTNTMPEVSFHMEESTAVITDITPCDGDPCVYANDLSAAMEFIQSLDFVQGVTLDSDEAER